MRESTEPGIRRLAVRVLVCVLSSSLFLTVFGKFGVGASEETGSTPGTSVSQESNRSASTFQVHSDLVLIPVTVTDGKGRTVAGLDKENFTVYQDKVQQAITHFSSEDAPTSIGILFDTSDSMGPKLSKAREAVAELLTMAHPDDEFFLVQFSSRPMLLVPMTSRQEEIRNQAAALTVSGATALLDAVSLAMREMRKARRTRKALIIISDGEDNASHISVHDLKQMVGQGDVLIYAIGMTNSSYSSTTWPPTPSAGSSLLREITSDTGGRLFEVSRVKDLPEIASKISGWLRSQYVLGYAPDISGGDVRYYHRIQVRLTKPAGFPRLHAIWRLGYYAPTE